ncbi:zinc finger MYND domain-containing protein [Phanerochaete sordida]|uniref:Zinc finger MYND domain-containing protein n=1 Tax=Phanerochaete sordida TaxID=48140 RepID=A0A9P3GEA7_9APHY|nr:zinc finger MYND domain-containing protein [Phanerochaete sordida]
MLKHWLELFPDDASDASQDASTTRTSFVERFHQVAASWPQLLCELCATEADDYDVDAWGWFQDFGDAVRDAPMATWSKAWEAGFLLVLAEAIDRGFLCGFTREQLVAEDRDDCFDRVNHMLGLLLTCTQRMIAGDCPQEVAQVLDVLQDTVLKVFAALWDTKDSFLIAEYTAAEGEIMDLRPGFGGLWEDRLDSVYNTLRELGYLTFKKLQEHRSIDIFKSHIPDVLLVTWVHAPYTSTRMCGLACMMRTVYDADEVTDMFPDFLASALGGSTRCKHVTDAIIRDLAEEEVTGLALANVVSFLKIWSNTFVDIGMNLADEEKLAPYCLAAARRQLCREDNTNPETFIDIMSGVFDNLELELEIHGRQYYDLVDLLCEYVSLSIQQNDARPPPYFEKHMDWLLKRIHHRAKDNSPKTLALRAHTQAAWQAVTDAMQRRRLVHRSIAWMQFAQFWFVLQGHLWPAPAVGDVVRAPFGAFERCAWRECLCSRHKPAHKLRSCRGCEQVVYCGKRCQKSDWEQGGHRERCRVVAQ